MLQSAAVTSALKQWLRSLLRSLGSAATTAARRWRLVLAVTVLGAVLSIVAAFRAPVRWISEGRIALRPTFLLEGYLLSANELADHYAVRLVAPDRVRRALATLPPAATAGIAVEASSEPGGVVWLRVEDTDPAFAEAVARFLLVDFRAEIERENRTREEADRLVLSVSRTSFARRLTPPLWEVGGRGALAGLVGGLLAALLQGWRQARRVSLPIEAEALTGAPTLAAIPGKRRPWSRSAL